MNTLVRAAFILSSLSMNALAESQPNLGHLNGWKYQDTAGSEMMRDFSGGANGLLSLETSSDASPPTVLVYEVPDRYLGKDLDTSIEAWRLATFRGKLDMKKTTIKDQVYQKNGKTQYFAEVSSDIDRPNMMPSVVLGKQIDKKVYVFIYENRRNIYQRNIGDVLKLFHQL
jgi:hypothetical protein